MFKINLQKTPQKTQQTATKSSTEKWLTLTFSKNKLIPDDNEEQIGQAGMRHCEFLFILPLLAFGNYLKRKVVLPPPWLCLEERHNDGKEIPKNIKWSDYYDLTQFKHIDLNPPLTFATNGRIISNRYRRYYNSQISLDNIDKNIDIAIISNFNIPKENIHSWDPIFTTSAKLNLYKNYLKSIKSEYIRCSEKIKSIIDNILQKHITDYTFIHIRRGDLLHRGDMVPPIGTISYTEPDFIASFIKNHNDIGNTIIIATNEQDITYKNKLTKLLSDKIVIYEEDIIKLLAIDIKSNNYFIYQIMHELACRSKINIVTVKLRLGNRIDYNLSKNK